MSGPANWCFSINFLLSWVLFYHFSSVIGAFDDPEITHVDDTVDPVRDLETISQELRLKVMCVFTSNLLISATC